MASVDVTSLIIKITSQGIDQAASSLNKLTEAAGAVEKVGAKVETSTKRINQTQKESSTVMDTLMAKFQKQADLLGANTAQTNAYQASMKNATAVEREMAAMLGAEVDAYKRLSASQVEAYRQKQTMQKRDIELQSQAARAYASAQSEAIRINAALDASYKRAAASASILARQQASANAKGQALNQAGFRAEEYKKLSQAQSEALRMNAALDASNKRLEMDRLAAIQMDKARSYKILADAQAEAIRMNNALDASQKRLNIDAARQAQLRHAAAMQEANSAARGLSGSLGALWLTYGNFAGMAVGLGIGAALKGIITIGADVENTLEGIRVRGQETIESANKVRDAIYKIGEGIYGPQEVAKAFESLTLAGLKVKDSSLAIGAALNLATSGGTTIEKAAEGLVSIGTAVGATAKNFDYLADGITMAANTSLASVDSITEAVKRASIVNKLYGASFEDILTQTAALAQLGIKNTAAGTAITNFYNNAVGNTQKSRKALDELGMSFTDATGKARPLVEAFEEFSNKLNKYDLKSQQNFINDIFGERALRDVEAMRSLVNSAADDSVTYSNRLREIQGQIGNAAGTASLQSVQLGMTAQKQMLAVGNTIKTSLTKSFEELSPQIMFVSSKLKEAFGSNEFITVLKNLASGFGNLVTFIAENTRVIGLLIEGFIAFKIAAMLAGPLTTLIAGLRGVSLAFGVITTTAEGATVAVGFFGNAVRIALGIAAPLLTAAALLWTALSVHTEESANKAQEYADTYNKDFAKALQDEVDRLTEINRLKAEGIDKSDAITQSMKNEALARFNLNSQNSIESARKELDAAREYSTALGPLSGIVMGEARRIRLEKAEKNYARLTAQRDDTQDNVSKVMLNSEVEKSSYKADEYVNDILSQFNAGTKVYDRKQEDKAGNNDRYSAALKVIDGELEKAKATLAQAERSVASNFKAGLISEFDMIDSISQARVDKLNKEIELNKKKLDTPAVKNKRTLREDIENKKSAAEGLLGEEKLRREEEYDVALKKMQDENYNNHYKQLILQGRNEEAAIEKSKRLFQDKIKTEELTLVESLQKMSMATGPEAEALRVKIATLAQSLNYAKGESEALISKGKIDDAELNTQKALEAVRVQIVGIKAAIPQGGLFAGIAADKSIASIRENAIPELERLYAIQKKLADTTKSPDAMKNLAKTGEELQKLREKSGGVDAWTGAQESIRKYAASATDAGTLIGDAMTNAFKGAEDALTTFIMTGKINFRSLATSIVADLARIQAKQMLMSISGGDSGSGGLFGGLLKSGIGSLMGGGLSSSGGTFGSLADLFTGSFGGGFFAEGGSPPLGKISMVGEEGPELFVPKSAGTIIPNHALQGPMQNGSSGSSDQPTNYTIVNQTTGRIDEVKEQRLNGNERALIIKETLSAVASSLYDANSNVSKGIKNNHNIQRVR